MNVIYCASQLSKNPALSSPPFYTFLLKKAAKVVWKAFLARDKLDQ